MSLSTDDLRMVIKVIEHMSFSKAAAELGYTQPNISKAVRNVENEFKAAIFANRKSSLRLTEFGEYFAASMVPMANEYEGLKMKANQYRLNVGSCKVHIGIPVQSAARIIAQSKTQISMNELTDKYVFVEESYDVLETKVSEGELDAAIVMEPVKEKTLSKEILFTDPLGVVLGKDSLLRDKTFQKPGDIARYISANDLKTERLTIPSKKDRFYHCVEPFLISSKFPKNLLKEISSEAMRKELADTGDSNVLYRESHVTQGNDRFCKIDGYPLCSTWVIVYKDKNLIEGDALYIKNALCKYPECFE